MMLEVVPRRIMSQHDVARLEYTHGCIEPVRELYLPLLPAEVSRLVSKCSASRHNNTINMNSNANNIINHIIIANVKKS